MRWLNYDNISLSNNTLKKFTGNVSSKELIGSSYHQGLHILEAFGSPQSKLFSVAYFRTLICQISAVINSRPLCSISENPNDLDVLTPAHFLIGAPLTSIPEPNLSTLNIGRLGHWQRIQFMQQVFWKRWSSEYLSLLQQRSRWRSSRDNIAVGTLVLIKDEVLPPLKWPLGRITQIFKGDDGMVRVAEIKTEGGVCKRAIAKLCALPIDDNEVGSIISQQWENVQSAIA